MYWAILDPKYLSGPGMSMLELVMVYLLRPGRLEHDFTDFFVFGSTMLLLVSSLA